MVVQTTRSRLSARLTCGLSVLLLAWAAGRAGAAVPTVEDLTGCKLPNGRVVLPVAGTHAADNGALYKFSTEKFTALNNSDGKPLAPDDTIAHTRLTKSADLQFLPEKGGSLLAFSGAISDVRSALFLSDLSGKKLDEPWPLPKTTANLAGECLNIQDGGIYLLKTTDDKFVLFRVLEKSDTAAVIQFVYQANGSTTFDIPINPALPYKRPDDAKVAAIATASTPGTSIVLPATAPLTTPRLPVSAAPAVRAPLLGPGDINEPGVIRILSDTPRAPGLEPTIDTFANQRNQMLQRRMDIIHDSARTPAEITRKAQAVADLGALHPDEAVVAELLVQEISFFNPRSQEKEFSPDALHPCFAALKHMGKAASAAVLKGMRTLDLDAPGDGIDSAMYKAKLLGMVLRSVEGDDVAIFILRREADRETDPKRRAVFEFLLKQ